MDLFLPLTFTLKAERARGQIVRRDNEITTLQISCDLVMMSTPGGLIVCVLCGPINN